MLIVGGRNWTTRKPVVHAIHPNSLANRMQRRHAPEDHDGLEIKMLSAIIAFVIVSFVILSNESISGDAYCDLVGYFCGDTNYCNAEAIKERHHQAAAEDAKNSRRLKEIDERWRMAFYEALMPAQIKLQISACSTTPAQGTGVDPAVAE